VPLRQEAPKGKKPLTQQEYEEVDSGNPFDVLPYNPFAEEASSSAGGSAPSQQPAPSVPPSAAPPPRPPPRRQTYADYEAALQQAGAETGQQYHLASISPMSELERHAEYLRGFPESRPALIQSPSNATIYRSESRVAMPPPPPRLKPRAAPPGVVRTVFPMHYKGRILLVPNVPTESTTHQLFPGVPVTASSEDYSMLFF
jgi:hypothetical protein